jgi:hypothetical protein
MSNNNTHLFWIQEPSILYKNNNFLKFIPTSNMDRVSQLNALTRFAIYFIILSVITGKEIIWIQMPIILIIFFIFLYFTFKFDIEGMKNDLVKMRGIDINGIGDEDYPERKDEKTEGIAIESGYYDSDNNLMIGEYLNSKPKHTKKLKFNLDDHIKYEKAICRQPTKENPFMNPLLNDITTNPEISPVACNVDDEDVQDKMNDCFNEDLYRDVGDLFERHNSQRQFYTVPQLYPNDQKSFAEWLYKTDDICKVDQSKCLKYEDLRYKRLTSKNS